MSDEMTRLDETAGGAETTEAVERATRAITPHMDRAQVAHREDYSKWARDALVAALTGDPNEYGMTDITAAIHRAVCDDSPDECISEHGRCLLATAYLRDALLLGGAA